MKYRTILLFGAPGAGKGTQGKILGSIPNFFHCACGDVFRSISPANRLGKIFIEYTSRGELVPDKPTGELWRRFIKDSVRAGRFHPKVDTLVLDGIPRTLHQAEMLRDTLDVRAVFYLHCRDFNRMVDRLQKRALKENRLDDANLDVIKHRFKVYEQETKPILNFYDKKLVHRIDSTQSPVKVLSDILRYTHKAIS
ncbi:MAG TPA: nucleoside monophosphate kinase [Verrucomicrobiae bacterium]|jgi:adenylate kinase|nr:nucleoside monophosphate kinase [Verrucomicrobiae bacterium]